MAITANVISQQSLQFDIPAPEAGSNRVFIATGIAQFSVGAFSQGPGSDSQTQSVRLLVDPVIAPGQFRKATAVVGLCNMFQSDANTAGQITQSSWFLQDVSATLDDESGKVELRFEVTAVSAGPSTQTGIQGVTFQVTTLATL